MNGEKGPGARLQVISHYPIGQGQKPQMMTNGLAAGKQQTRCLIGETIRQRSLARGKDVRAYRQRIRLALLRLLACFTAPLIPRSSSLVLHPSSILLIRPDHIGDLLFTTPALRALRAAFPQAYIAYLAGPWARAIVENNPHIDEVIVCECPGFTRRPKASFLEPYTLLLKYARRLRRRNFDLAINLRFDFWWGALLAYLAGIRQRVGYDIAECRPFLTEAVPHTKGKHEVEQNLTLIEAVTNGLRNMHDSNKALTDETICQVAGRQGTGGKGQVRLEFEPTGEEREFAAHYLFERGVEEGDKLICIHPGAGAPVKLWRREGFAQVADVLAQRHGVRVILTGSERERPLVQAIADGMREAPIVAAGDLALGQLAAVMERCSLVLGVDSGPLHLAVAMGTPTVHLYGPVDHRAFGPWGDPARHLVLLADLDCIPCNRLDYPPKELADHPCVRLISVEQVLAACERLIG